VVGVGSHLFQVRGGRGERTTTRLLAAREAVSRGVWPATRRKKPRRPVAAEQRADAGGGENRTSVMVVPGGLWGYRRAAGDAGGTRGAWFGGSDRPRKKRSE
jgi:hypothetical protein